MEQYALPLARPGHDGLPLRWPRRGEGRILASLALLRSSFRGRRLAYLDTHFPWRRSGFRYFDALEVARLLPDTVFFSQCEMTDPFPSAVHPLADFPRLALRYGVTDVYAVFLTLASSLLGIREVDGRPWRGFTPGLDISSVMRRGRMRCHIGLYPGGGVIPGDPDSRAVARAVAERSDTVISWVPELADLPHRVDLPVAYTPTDVYEPSDRRWQGLRAGARLRCVFAADDKPRKGLATVLAAFASAAEADLELIGPHAGRVAELGYGQARVHGWLEPEAMAEVYQRCHIVLSPAERERPDDPEGDGGVVDGFPTSTVCDAMATGALAIVSNPTGRPHPVLRPGEHFVEIPNRDPAALHIAVDAVRADPEHARRVALAGCDVVRRQLSVHVGSRTRLRAMDLLPPAAAGT